MISGSLESRLSGDKERNSLDSVDLTLYPEYTGFERAEDPVSDGHEPITDKRYILLEINPAGRGCWGAVYKHLDLKTLTESAIKVSEPTEFAFGLAKKRGITPDQPLANEGFDSLDLPNIVQRKFLTDLEGKEYLAMRYYDTFLSDILQDNSERQYLGNGISYDQLMRYMGGISRGMYGSHEILGMINSDIKGENIALDDEDNPLLTDFGSSVSASDIPELPRDRIGWIYTRAPEMFRDGSHPTKQSDMWSFGSLMYRLITGEYFMEEELKDADDTDGYINNLDKNRYDTILERKMDRLGGLKGAIPEGMIDILSTCLQYNPNDRYKNTGQLMADIDSFTAEYELTQLVSLQDQTLH